ncbi:MAG: NTP transferase domain-containing protein [Phycisphaerales bacterium]
MSESRDSSRREVVGVLLAAGRGRRMGTLKQLLGWNDRTLVECAFDALARHCGAGMVVTLGAEADRVAAALAPRAFERVEVDPDAEMLDSIRAGLKAAQRQTGARAALLHPADHPFVVAPVVAALLDAHDERPTVAIRPTHGGRGGHPTLIPLTLVEHLAAWNGEGGLRRLWEERPDLVHSIEFPDEERLRIDLDTPEDYAAALRFRD